MSLTLCFFRAVAAVAVLIAPIALTGCSGSTSSISGTVTANGQPVTGGSVTFLPQATGESQLPGAPVSAEIGADGKYKTDGAVSGSSRISYSAPLVDPPGTIYKPGEGPKKSPYDGMKPDPETVEIKSGANTVEIKLVK